MLSVVEESESASIVGRGDEKLETLRENGTESTRRIVEEATSRSESPDFHIADDE